VSSPMGTGDAEDDVETVREVEGTPQAGGEQGHQLVSFTRVFPLH
jgi:hypothetical protein